VGIASKSVNKKKLEQADGGKGESNRIEGKLWKYY
jgi:hypothetical protein